MASLDTAGRDGRVAALQLLLLLVGAGLLLRNEVGGMFADSVHDPEVAHLLVAPLLVGLLWWRRRAVLAEALRPGSWFGVLLMLAGCAIYAASTWPYNYLQPRRMSFIVVAAGAVLAVGGWGVLRRAAPILLILLLAIPIGARFYARLIVRPETITLSIVESIVDLLPGVIASRDGLDITYLKDGAGGSIALGEPNRGAAMYLALLTVGIYVGFSRIRPAWQHIAAAIAAGPILLVANVARLVAWAIATIGLDADPLDGRPRVAGTITCLLVGWLLFGAVYGACAAAVHHEPDDSAAPEPETSA